jgi:hypothetical protein
MNRLPLATLLLPTVFLSACAAQGSFPSLAARAAERGQAGGSAPALCPEVDAPDPAAVASAPAPPPSDPQLRSRITELLAQARAGQTEFASLLPRAQAAIGRSGAAESEAWIEAQQQLSRLEAARARTVDALAELDSLGISRSAGAAATANQDRTAIAQAEDEVRALAEAQQTELARLSAQLGV